MEWALLLAPFPGGEALVREELSITYAKSPPGEAAV